MCFLWVRWICFNTQVLAVVGSVLQSRSRLFNKQKNVAQIERVLDTITKHNTTLFPLLVDEPLVPFSLASSFATLLQTI